MGDGAVGKTSLIVSYTTNGFPSEYIPTAFDNYNVVVNVDNQPILLQLCDTAGQDDFDNLRTLCYDNTDVYVVCFSVVSPASFANVASRWIPELRQHSPDTPVILVGTQADLRTDVKVLIELARYGEKPVEELEAIRLSNRVGARTYVECSALTQRNLKEVFDEAIVGALASTNNPLNRTGSSRRSHRILHTLQNWRTSSQLLRSSTRRSKSSTTKMMVQEPLPVKPTIEEEDSKKPRRSIWRRIFCSCCTA